MRVMADEPGDLLVMGCFYTIIVSTDNIIVRHCFGGVHIWDLATDYIIIIWQYPERSEGTTSD